MHKLLIIALGGAIGAVSRFLMSETVFKLTGNAYPLGTMLVNLTGCFLIGLLWGVFNTFEIDNNLKPLIFTGFLGAFTTFSTFALENFYLIRNGEIQILTWNILISNIAGIVLVFAGYYLATFLCGLVKG